MVYQRQIYPRLEAELKTREILVLTGMRRVGKTTAINYLYDLVETDNKAIFDLENPLHRKIFEEEDYDAVWSNLRQSGISNTSKAYIFIDEVQNLPDISRVVKYLYDHWDVKFVLTGSSSYYLRNLFPESLAGRKVVFELFPLNFAEFLVFKGLRREGDVTFEAKAKNKNRIVHEKLVPSYDEFMEFGGFPSVVLEENHERKRVLLSEIFTSYFEKDAKNLADFEDMAKLRDLILLLIPRVGCRVEIAKLAATLDTTRQTVYGYLAFLEGTYFISLLPKYSGSVDIQAAGKKKLFLCDSGVANVLGKFSEGQLFEQSVFQNLKADHALTYYNKEGSGEIDFVVDSTTGLEVKVSASRWDVSQLQRRSRVLKLKESYLVSHDYSEYPETVLATSL